MPLFRQCLIALSVSLFAVTMPALQEAPKKPDPPQAATVMKTVTRLVVVDVVVSDHKGRPVSDLTRNDFTVLEDGKEQQIKVFTFQHPTPGDPLMTVHASLDPPNVFSNFPKYSANTALNVVLLDGLNTTLLNQSYVRDQMLRYMEKLPQGQPIAVYTLGTRLNLLQDFTTDASALKEKIRKLKGLVSPLLDSPSGSPQEQMLPAGSFDSGSLAPSLDESLQRFEAERSAFQTDMRVRSTLAAFTALAHNLAGYPGRKNLIWISESFPLTIDPDASLGTSAFAARSYQGEITDTANALIDSQIAVYPIDARGLTTLGTFSAANNGRDSLGRARGRNGAAMLSDMSRESSALEAAHAAMNSIADETGGKAFYNRNDIDGAIRTSIEDGSTYYTLAYYPENKNWNGKFRKIHVKIDRREVKLRYRSGYYARNPEARAKKEQDGSEAALARALSLEYPTSTNLLFRAGVIEPSAQTQNRITVNFAIDAHAISFDPQEDGLQHASVECVVQAYTEKGKPVSAEGSTINAALREATFAKVMHDAVFPCQSGLELKPGNYLLRLGVRDKLTGLTGSADGKITVK